jgi:hypothetical protein
MGGYIGITLVASTMSALAAARLRRRRSGTSTSPPLPETITAVQRAYVQYLNPIDEDDVRPRVGIPDLPDDVRHALPGAPSRPVGVVAFGSREQHEVALDLNDTVGLGLIGPGTDDTVRAMMAALLDSGSQDVRVLIPAADLRRLLPDMSAPRHPRLRMAADLGDALAAVEAELLHRQVEEQYASDHDTRHGDQDQPITVLVATPDRASTPRLRAALSHSVPGGFTAILLDTWPSGLTMHITAQGVVYVRLMQARATAGEAPDVIRRTLHLLEERLSDLETQPSPDTYATVDELCHRNRPDAA